MEMQAFPCELVNIVQVDTSKYTELCCPVCPLSEVCR